MQLQESSNCLNKMHIELLLCLACLWPDGSFAAFDKQELLCLTEFYLNDLSLIVLITLEIQLHVYIMHLGFDNNFSGLEEIEELPRKIVETKND